MENKEQKLDNTLNEIFNDISSNETKKTINKLIDSSIRNKVLMTKYDVLERLNLSILKFNDLKNLLKQPNITSYQTNLIRQIINKVNIYCDVINDVNDKIIKSGARISKNAMNFILKEDVKENGLVIINVSLDPEDTNHKIKIKELKDTNNNKDYREKNRLLEE